MVKVKKDLTGMKFGRLTVLRQDENDYVNPTTGERVARWICQCDCGAIKSIASNNLKHGSSKSCGCAQREATSKRRGQQIKVHSYRIENEVAIFTTLGEKEFQIDAEDVDKIIGYWWKFNREGYVRTSTSSKSMSLHRLIMNCPEGKIVDHINHDTADNRKSNLRIVTDSQSMMNTHLRSDNTHGTRGICFRKDSNMWTARIGYQGKRFFLGCFKTKEEAIAARKQAEEKYYGEFNYNPDNDVRNMTAQKTGENG